MADPLGIISETEMESLFSMSRLFGEFGEFVVFIVLLVPHISASIRLIRHSPSAVDLRFMKFERFYYNLGLDLQFCTKDSKRKESEKSWLKDKVLVSWIPFTVAIDMMVATDTLHPAVIMDTMFFSAYYFCHVDRMKLFRYARESQEKRCFRLQ